MKDLIVLIMLLLATEGKSKTCSAGEFMNSDGICSSCPPGTYRSELGHTFPFCIHCHPRQEHVSVHYPCNATHNTGCPIGSFQSQATRLVCQLCNVCEVYEARPCTPTSDAICCRFKDMTLVEKANESVPCKNESSDEHYCCELQSQATTKRVSIDKMATGYGKMTDTAHYLVDSMKNMTCSRNMYIDQSTKRCKSCDPCSYIDKETHSQQSCDLCSSDKSRSRLVYCPKHCGSYSSVGMEDVEIVVISFLTVIFLSTVLISLYVLCIISSRHSVLHLV